MQKLSIRSISFLILIIGIQCDTNNKANEDFNQIFKLLFISCHQSIKCVPNPYERVKHCKCNYYQNEIDLLKLNIKVIQVDKDTATYFSALIYDRDTCCRYQQPGVKKYGYKKKYGFFPMEYGNFIYIEKYNFQKNNDYFFSKIKFFNKELKSRGKSYFNYIDKKHFNNKYTETYKNAERLFSEIL